MDAYLSIARYFTGMGGLLLAIIVVLTILLLLHVKESNVSGEYYDFFSTFYIGTMLGLALLFITVPTLCFLRSTLMCYQVM
ncbi:hypothetical protein MZD04_gp081 [Pseudomonas phage Psa21]|uniref:Uncharacterized protein n=1 Tax=Pseudomonas phage Psa21 TaxID=2530023 RepID=A0A481W4E7_9CAUD|nr:hypothetical protein MZD04_gp081 [Pseudomonas phage Psa21]QBJ02610.1 hypothetical protein PSA21_81 [Pseudomonas phage Psa21]